jgi:hypothetical protein
MHPTRRIGDNSTQVRLADLNDVGGVLHQSFKLLLALIGFGVALQISSITTHPTSPWAVLPKICIQTLPCHKAAVAILRKSCC